MAAGQRVLLDDGLIMLEVVEPMADGVRCTVLNTAEIGEPFLFYYIIIIL